MKIKRIIAISYFDIGYFNKSTIHTLACDTFPNTYFSYSFSCPNNYMVTLYTETIQTPESIIWSSNPSYGGTPKGVFTISGDWISMCPVPSFTAWWSNNFGGTLISYNASTPRVSNETNTHYQTNVNFTTNTTANVTISTHYECSYDDQQQCSGGTNHGSTQIVLTNYPQSWITNHTLSWATQLAHETDGKHITFKVNDIYVTSDIYTETNPLLGTVYNIVYSMYVGSNPTNGNYNNSGNYYITGNNTITLSDPITNYISTTPSTIRYLSG